VLGQGEDIVPIPGTKRRRYLDENLGALAVQLTADELSAINAVFPPDAAVGTRYPEAMMATIGR
jgi:aryl-alcohol dehydrogenase-like predicted oxidoreductase